MSDIKKKNTPVFDVNLFCTIKWVRAGIKNKYQLYGLHQTTAYTKTGIKWLKAINQ